MRKCLHGVSQVQKSQEEAQGEGRKVHKPRGQEELRDEAGKLLSLDSMQRTVGSMECVTPSDLYFCVQENGLREQS